MAPPSNQHVVENFGRNVRSQPRHVYHPQTEAEVLEILRRHRGEPIRGVGSRHSWSEGIVTDGVLVDVGALQEVRVASDGGPPRGIVGAGCTIYRLVQELRRQGGITLPSLGLINKQTIAGATATGTHGSGRYALGQYITSLRVAHYDDQGVPTISTIAGGEALRAARCGLGALGIVVSVELECRTDYRIEEHLAFYERLEDVLEGEADYPLQQFFLLPWAWRFLAQHRRESSRGRSWHAGLYRFFWWLWLDIGLHLIITSIARRKFLRGTTKSVFRSLLPRLVVPGWRVVDRAADQLVMEHQLFRHIEIEMFVTRSQLPAAVRLAGDLIRIFGGEAEGASLQTWEELEGIGMADRVRSLAGSYCHHYVVCVRKVLADDSPLSMAGPRHAGVSDPGQEEATYALSFISYHPPDERQGFYGFADVLCEAMAELVEGRPHWGKYCPLDRATAERLYPQLTRWRNVVHQFDPAGSFANLWLREVLLDEIPQRAETTQHEPA